KWNLVSQQQRSTVGLITRKRSRMRRYVIFNPVAGSVKNVDAVRTQLQRLDPVAMRVTRRRGEAEKFAREAIRKKCDCIVTAGGDGTLNEGANGTRGTAAKLRTRR